MPVQPHPATWAILLLVPLVAWRVYARVRRHIGRQRAGKVRPWVQVVLFPLLILLLAFFTRTHPERFAVLAGGVIAGVVLARYGWRLTRLEATPEGLYYTPCKPIGIALSLLFVGRLAYRLVEMYGLGMRPPDPGADFARSPLTLAIFGLLAGYYITYAVFLIRWRAQVMEAKRRREASEAAAAMAKRLEEAAGEAPPAPGNAQP